MKKILSTLVMCLILGVGSVWAQTYESTLNVTIKAEYRSTPTATDGEIVSQVCTYEEVDGQLQPVCASSKSGITYTLTMDKPEDNGVLGRNKAGDYQKVTRNLSGSIDLSSSYLGDNNKYVFSHWEVSDSQSNLEVTFNATSSASKCNYTIAVEQQVLFNISGAQKTWWNLTSDYTYTVTSKGTVPVDITFTAVWVQPQVTGVDNTNYTLPTITDVGDSRTQNVSFNLKDDVAKNNFACQTEGVGFSLSNTAWTGNSDIYTATVTYVPTGIDGVHTGTVTLTSNHPSVDPTSATSTLTVEEDYTPVFTVPASYAVSTVELPTYVGAYTQLLETDIVPTDLNYAARTILPQGAVEKINGAEWKVELPESENPSTFFSLKPFGSTQVIRFTPTGTVDPTKQYTAKLYVTCTYYDAEGTPLTTRKSVTLSAYAKNDASARLEIGNSANYDMNFGDVIYGTPYEELVSYVAVNIATPNEEWSTTSSEITYANYGSMIAVRLSENLPMGYQTATLQYTSGSQTATLNIFANVILGRPELSAYAGLSQITLNWTPVYGANKYIIKRDDVDLKEITDPTIISYVDENLTNGTEYSYTITAVYTADESKNTISDIATAIPNIPGTITVEDLPYLGLYTGTNKFNQDDPIYGTFPYSEKRLIDLSKTFDIYGRPLFDELYILGVTTNTDGGDDINLPSASAICNAKTPLYVYAQDSENSYKKIAEYDAVTKRFDHGTTKSSRALYFTGYCPFANIGLNPEDEGWMYFTGEANETVDLYLDNCTLIGRCRTDSGGWYGFDKGKIVTLEASVGTVLTGKENKNFMTGFSSIFVFSAAKNTSAKPYKPSIHISGNNHLKGQIGHIKNVQAKVLGQEIDLKTLLGYEIANVTTVSSPITIKPDANMGFTNLTLDDLWPISSGQKAVTNGLIRLDTYPVPGQTSEKVSSIDLGSENASLTINGGQYIVRNAAADGTYTCNLAFSHRKFYKEAEALGMTAKVSLYGFGGDQTDNTVTINGGTFSMYPNVYVNGTDVLGKPIYLGSQYYIDSEFLDLRLPDGRGSSAINGGTFNDMSHVVFCSLATSSGKSPRNNIESDLCLQDVPIDGLNEEQNNGSVKFTIPDPFKYYERYGQDDLDRVEYDLSTETGWEYVGLNALYGGQSANAYIKNIDGENKYVVSVLLPAVQCEGESANCADCEIFDEAIYYNWAIALPKMRITAAGNDAYIGGDTKVWEDSDAEETLPAIVNQMLYVDLSSMADDEDEDQTIGFASEKSWGNFTNTNDYRIYKNLNILKSVEADRWYCFVAPYDIHEISVIETSETELSKSEYKDDRAAAKTKQANDNLQIFKGLSDFIFPDPNGRATSLTLNELMPNGGLGMPGLKRSKLTHFNGENFNVANYYLFEIPDGDIDRTGSGFNIEWTPVSNAAGEPLMYQGKVYAIQFPWCPMCNDWETRTYYDYWTNKMILFYGRGYAKTNVDEGGQLVFGKGHQTSTILAINPEQGTAMYSGNYTLADMTAPTNAYVHDYDVDKEILDGLGKDAADWFIQAPSGHTVKPTEGYMLYTPKTGAQMPARISRTGQIEYGENVETGLPTIAGRTSLMLLGAYDGFELLSLCEQLVTVYNLQGNIIFQQYMAEGQQVYVATGTGVFIVRGESETIKVMVE